MESVPSLFIGTIILRPYVFAFLLAYLLGCSLHLGVKRALYFCVAGYLIAWLSEYSSIHNGFPYGPYYYIETTKNKELWLLGVPFMDSLSYVFLAYASYSTALVVVSPLVRIKGMFYPLVNRGTRNSLQARIMGAIFFVYLDIIIDPVALKGNKWFLGRIYGYPEPGAYFGVPISNFIGWFVVGFLMITALQAIDAYPDKKGAADHAGHNYPWSCYVGPFLYLSVVIFNLAVTFAIGETTMGWAGVFIMLLFLLLVSYIVKIRLSINTAANVNRKDTNI